MSQELTTQTNEFSLHDYTDLLRRRKYTIIQAFVVIMVVGAIVTFLTKPTYRTGSGLLVEGKMLTVNSVQSNDPLANLFLPDVGHDIATQIEVLQGENILKDAYQAAGVPIGTVKLDVKARQSTDVIDITVDSNNPLYAEKMARQLPITYENYITGNRGKELDRALKSSQGELASETQKLNQVETSLEQFKARTHIPNIEADRTQKIADAGAADTEQEKASTTVASAKVKLQTLQAIYAAQPKDIDTPTTVDNTNAITALKDEIAKTEGERQKLLLLVKPNNFKVTELDTQIDVLKKRLAGTPATITTNTRTKNPNLDIYNQKVVDAQSALVAAEAELTKAELHVAHSHALLAKYGPLDRRQYELERELKQHQTITELLGTTVQNLSLHKITQHDPLVIISPAGPALQIAPKKMTNLAYSAVVGLILGFGLALLQEFMDDRINGPEDARRMFKAPVLGYLPLIEKEDGRLLSTASSSSSTLESYRALRSNVRFATVGSPVTSILVTSSAPGEGKSLTASNLAVAMALDGRKVILVDTDLRRPTVHAKFGTQQSPGLTNVLVDHTSLTEALRDTEIPGLQLLTAGPMPPNPAELLNSEPMQRVHAQLKSLADVIIFDSPPCLAISDAQILSASVDGVLYVIQMGETKKSGVKHAMDMLQNAHANILGLVFNKIDLTTMKGGYYYAGYYNYYYYTHYNPVGPDGTRKSSRTAEFESLLPKNGTGIEDHKVLTDSTSETENKEV